DHYQVLGIEKDCTETDIKNAYRRLALLHHPDKNPGCKISEEKFKQINNAYETLLDPEKRTIYN
ncbi:heat shock protein DnaJ, partial [Hyaloscypha hepaticicola]